MSKLISSLTHLEPPDIVRLAVERFSPYHETPAHFGLALCGPQQHYDFIYRLEGIDLHKLAYSFEYAYVDDQDPEIYAATLKTAITNWKSQYRPGSLTYRRGPAFCLITDRRPTTEQCDFRLHETESQIYFACDSGASPETIWRSLQHSGNTAFTHGQIEHFLVELLNIKLVFEENGKFLSLAIPAKPEIFRSQPAELADVSKDATALVIV